MNPDESIVILTNENISLDGKHAVLIVPRVSMSEVGIILTPAYIDSYYQGILRLNIHNNSTVPFKLKSLEVVAQCFFFDFSGSVVPTSRRQAFAQKSVFFSQNWKSILESDVDPFPTKKKKANGNPFKEFLSAFLENYTILLTATQLLLLLVR